MRIGVLLYIFALIAIAGGLYQMKFEVQRIEDKILSAKMDISEDRKTIRVLEAEWSHLNDPERLQFLAKKHLDMRTTGPGQIIAADALPPKFHPEWDFDPENRQKTSDGDPVPLPKPWSLDWSKGH